MAIRPTKLNNKGTGYARAFTSGMGMTFNEEFL
jgi:hypothetical protein